MDEPTGLEDGYDKWSTHILIIILDIVRKLKRSLRSLGGNFRQISSLMEKDNISIKGDKKSGNFRGALR